MASSSSLLVTNCVCCSLLTGCILSGLVTMVRKKNIFFDYNSRLSFSFAYSNPFLFGVESIKIFRILKITKLLLLSWCSSQQFEQNKRTRNFSISLSWDFFGKEDQKLPNKWRKNFPLGTNSRIFTFSWHRGSKIAE